jgi:hypothetical protein
MGRKGKGYTKELCYIRLENKVKVEAKTCKGGGDNFRHNLRRQNSPTRLIPEGDDKPRLSVLYEAGHVSM